jgi:hypothetical protein
MTTTSRVRFVELSAKSLLRGSACRDGGAMVMLYVAGSPGTASEQNAVAAGDCPNHDGDKTTQSR